MLVSVIGFGVDLYGPGLSRLGSGELLLRLAALLAWGGIFCRLVLWRVMADHDGLVICHAVRVVVCRTDGMLDVPGPVLS